MTRVQEECQPRDDAGDDEDGYVIGRVRGQRVLIGVQDTWRGRMIVTMRLRSGTLLSLVIVGCVLTK